MSSTNVFNECLRRMSSTILSTQFQLQSRNDVILTNAFGECFANVFDDFQQRSSNYKVGIKSTIFQLRSRNKISDFQSLMPKPTIHPRSFISFENAVHRCAMNKSIIELRASDVIKCAHISGEGGFVILIELLVNAAKGFQEIQHDSC